jgi:hypothetical protein
MERRLYGPQCVHIYPKLPKPSVTSVKLACGLLTPYLQAGDIGIYKVFKDLVSAKINVWKRSDSVEYTRFGNPRAPRIETVCGWVKESWCDTPTLTVQNSIEIAGFSPNPERWYIWNHDVYDWKFQRKWNEKEEKEEEFRFSTDDLNDAMNDISLVEE